MKDFIKKNALWVLLTIAMIAGLLFAAQKLKEKSVSGVITQADKETALNKQKNELTTYYLEQNAEIAEALEIAQKQISDGLRPQIIYKEKKAEQLVDLARKDTNTTALCDSAMNAQEEVIFDMGLKANSDSIALAACDRGKQIKDSLILVKENAFQEQIRINKDLQKTTKRNFVERNGFVLGAGAASALVVALKFISGH